MHGELTVKVSVAVLFETLTENLQEHRNIFLKAQEKYRAAVIEALEQRLEAARNPDGKIDTAFYFAVPTDHSEDYQRILGMLKMCTEETIDLDEESYSQYVLDNWSWKRQWATTNASYGLA